MRLAGTDELDDQIVERGLRHTLDSGDAQLAARSVGLELTPQQAVAALRRLVREGRLEVWKPARTTVSMRSGTSTQGYRSGRVTYRTPGWRERRITQ